METPKSQTQYDPNLTPFNSPASRFAYLEIDKQIVKVNVDSKVVVPMEDNPYPGTPMRLPPELMAVDQPYIRTCGRATTTNKGCLAAEGGGCSILSRYGRVGWVNVIVEKDNKVDSAPCHNVFCGVSSMGRPTTQSQMLLKGWRILTDRTTIPENVLNPATNQLEVRYTEVPNLAPFYEDGKVGRFAEKAAEEPKRRGRPKGSKNANREEVVSPGS